MPHETKKEIFLRHLESASRQITLHRSLSDQANFIFSGIVYATRRNHAKKQCSMLKTMAKYEPPGSPRARKYQKLAEKYGKIANSSFVPPQELFGGREVALGLTQKKEEENLWRFLPFYEITMFDEETLALFEEEKTQKPAESAEAGKALQVNHDAIEEIKIEAQHFNKKALNAIMSGFLITTGMLLTVVTHGVCAAQGGAMISEGLSKLHELSENTIVHKKLDNLNNQNALLAKLDLQITQTNQEALYETWSDLIKKHCTAQRASLHAIKEHFIEETVNHNDMLDEIDHYDHLYATQLQTLEEKKTLPIEKKLEATQKIAFAIQSMETSKIIPFAKAAKAILPPPAHGPSNSLISRATHFYHENKKFFQVAGLVALTAIGIGLTVATGGIAGVLGAAALASVVLSPVKSLLTRAKEKIFNVSTETTRLKTHTHNQYDTLGNIDKSISDKNAHTDIQKERMEYKKEEADLTTLAQNKTLSDAEKTLALQTVAKRIEATDQKSITTLKNIDVTLPETAKKESTHFMDRAKNFLKENKEGLRLASKIALGVVAVGVLIATGGTAAAVAAGLAVGAAAVSYATQKIAKKVKASSVNKEPSDDEGEGEHGPSAY